MKVNYGASTDGLSETLASHVGRGESMTLHGLTKATIIATVYGMQGAKAIQEGKGKRSLQGEVSRKT